MGYNKFIGNKIIDISKWKKRIEQKKSALIIRSFHRWIFHITDKNIICNPIALKLSLSGKKIPQYILSQSLGWQQLSQLIN
jgi:hypothetical protein